jgi:hypothetical protein
MFRTLQGPMIQPMPAEQALDIVTAALQLRIANLLQPLSV